MHNLDSKLPFSMFCVIGVETSTPPIYGMLSQYPRHSKPGIIQYFTIYWLYENINNEQMILPLQKKHLHVKNRKGGYPPY